jgi:hypothetical protein
VFFREVSAAVYAVLWRWWKRSVCPQCSRSSSDEAAPLAMSRRYYSSRKNPGSLTLESLYFRFQNLYLYFRGKDYFKQHAGITKDSLPDEVQQEAMIYFDFQAFPITKWAVEDITEDHIFDVLEFLFDRVSKPGVWTSMLNDTGFNYFDYDGYDQAAGRSDFSERANSFLVDYGPGYELNDEGRVVILGENGLQHILILKAEIIPYDEENVDRKVKDAIKKWKSRHPSREDRKQAIRELAGVFEWLQKTKRLEKVLDNKDESTIFDLANNFAIRHHNPKQKTNYDKDIWFSWIFHFYLATYHAAIRLLIKREKARRNR